MSDLYQQFQLFLQFQQFLQAQNQQVQIPPTSNPQQIYLQQQQQQQFQQFQALQQPPVQQIWSEDSSSNYQQFNFYQQKNQPYYYPQQQQQFFRVPSVDDGKEIIYSNAPLIEHIDLAFFKTQPCQIQQPHNQKQCVYYHNAQDRKRLGQFYISDMCETVAKNQPCQDQCTKSHNRVESLYRPEKYKTKFCPQYPKNCGKCEYGIFCPFAHSETDIMSELIHNLEYDEDFYIFHFKTVWCPYNYINHDQAECVYSHTWIDYRRKPHLYNYESQACLYWKNDELIKRYEEACPFKYQCQRCHGVIEQNYHPKFYKTQPCQFGQCPKGLSCPFYHNEQEQRVIAQKVDTCIFKYMPRNRIVEGTFKKQNGSKSNSGSIQMPQSQQFIPQTNSRTQIKITNLNSTQSLPGNFGASGMDQYHHQLEGLPQQQQTKLISNFRTHDELPSKQQQAPPQDQQLDWLTEEFENLMRSNQNQGYPMQNQFQMQGQPNSGQDDDDDEDLNESDHDQ